MVYTISLGKSTLLLVPLIFYMIFLRLGVFGSQSLVSVLKACWACKKIYELCSVGMDGGMASSQEKPTYKSIIHIQARCYTRLLLKEDFLMIVIDVETTGIDPSVNGIASIGAIMLPGENPFYQEVCVDENIKIDAKALEINGFTLESLNDSNKPNMARTTRDFADWATHAKDTIVCAWNAKFDVGFLAVEYERAHMYWPFGYRVVDLHSIVHFLMSNIGDGFVPAHDGITTIGLNYALKWAGLPEEPKPHNALAGARCNLDILRYCKGLLKSINRQPIFPAGAASAYPVNTEVEE
jgi:DNA polymerase-3 subunit epsilon